MHERAVFALLEQNCDHSQLAVVIRMYKVYRHLEGLAIDLFFTGPVKMKLLQHVFLVTDQDEASGTVIDHDGVAVIDDVERGRLVFEVDRRQVCLLRIADVNGGLVMSSLARCELWFQVAPMIRPKLGSVIPSVLGVMLLRGTTQRQYKNTEDKRNERQFGHVQPREK